MKATKNKRLLLAVNHYVVFFLLVAFVVTCCMMLFISTLTATLGITLTESDLAVAAKVTFANVVLLSLLFTLVDLLRRKLTVEKPVKQITEATQKLMQGDFTVRIEKAGVLDPENSFEEIIDCFNKMAEELQGVETLKTDFISNVSHELKTPLAVMQNYCTLLKSPELTEEKKLEYAGEISAAAKRLSSLITNILRLNKLENQQIAFRCERYDLAEQLCECLLGFEDIWEGKGLNIETELEDGVFVVADGEMMSLVWNNLFSNAIKFTDRGGTVSLKLFSEGDCAVIQVSDTGCGISTEVGKHIFDKFYQGDKSHSSQGNGLGLALVKRVIDITESEISVESILGKGTTFTVRMRKG